ncbi:MAG TPA: histidine kinase [Chitinophagaceae bacterium]|nr:histidine kinase [Chitinophagaceae bacterium]
MKTFGKSTRIQWYSFLASMPLIDFGLNHIFYGDRLFHDYRIWLLSFPLVWLIGLGTWYNHVLYDCWVVKKYPEIKQSVKRVILKSCVVLLVMTPSILLIFVFYDWLHIFGYRLHQADLEKGLLLGFSVNLIFLTLWESMYIIDKHRESIAEKEIVKQMSIQQEFDVLKSQVNPHFLFNCFNTLSSLIAEDPARAEAFLDELSKVYRYLLRNNETGLSTLQNELRFIESYFRLLKTRHGEAVQFQIETDKRYDNYLVPSLSLQLLVENAVKHNVLSKNVPLTIEIFTTAGNKLVINNNLQRRTLKVPSNRVGLDNIRSKYALLKQKGFQVMEDAKSFTVVLPLIWDNGMDKKWMPLQAQNNKTIPLNQNKRL